MSRVFVDSSAFFALINSKDSHHDEAMALMDRLARQGDELLTSNFIVAETHALLLNKVGRDIAARFLARMVSSEVRVIRVTEGDERRAREIIFRYTDQTPSFTDATSFAIVERQHLHEVATFDDDFSTFGFAVVS